MKKATFIVKVTFTTLVKGLCTGNRVKDAFEVLDEMKEFFIKPNLRTWNAILRGCVQWGNVDIALKV